MSLTFSMFATAWWENKKFTKEYFLVNLFISNKIHVKIFFIYVWNKIFYYENNFCQFLNFQKACVIHIYRTIKLENITILLICAFFYFIKSFYNLIYFMASVIFCMLCDKLLTYK